MNDVREQRAPAKRPKPIHVRIVYYGATIMLAGLLAAALIYATTSDDRAPDPAADIESSRVYEYNVERIGGMAAVYTARFNRWLAALWHGRPLAYTLAALAVAIGLGCFWVAHMVYVRLPSAGRGDSEP